MNILITGINSFVGRRLATVLQGSRHITKGTTRNMRAGFSSRGYWKYLNQVFATGDIDEKTDWKEALDGIDVVIHLAARVHVMNDSATDILTEYRKINTAGTLNLARQAVEAGVKRFIFISTIKVNGEKTESRGQAFSEGDIPYPQDAYAISKWEAEQGLLAIAEKTGMEVVIIRPPLIYGPGVKANFRSLVKWVKRGVPLPLGAVHNKRSFVALDNLVNFIIHCIDHPKAANEIFLISDGEDLSTTELLQKIAHAFGKRSFLLPVPVGLMSFLAGMLGKRNITNRLFGSLQVDCSKARELLGWKPVISMDEELKGLTQQCKKDKT